MSDGLGYQKHHPMLHVLATTAVGTVIGAGLGVSLGSFGHLFDPDEVANVMEEVEHGSAHFGPDLALEEVRTAILSHGALGGAAGSLTGGYLGAQENKCFEEAYALEKECEKRGFAGPDTHVGRLLAEREARGTDRVR